MPYANVGMGRPWAIRTAAGTVVYEGLAFGPPYDIIASAAIVRGGAVIIDGTATFTAVGGVFRYDFNTAGTEVLFSTAYQVYGTPVAAATSVGFLGVAQEPIAIGQTGRIAGPGAISPVLTTATTIAVGAAIIGSATPGSCAGSASPTIGYTLGECIMTNTVATPGTGSTAYALVLVAPR